MPAVEDRLAVETFPPRPPSRLSAILAKSGFLGALSTHDFAMLFSGQFASEIGNGLIQLALPWLVLQLRKAFSSAGLYIHSAYSHLGLVAGCSWTAGTGG
jgi:hypothetical protein